MKLSYISLVSLVSHISIMITSNACLISCQENPLNSTMNLEVERGDDSGASAVMARGNMGDGSDFNRRLDLTLPPHDMSVLIKDVSISDLSIFDIDLGDHARDFTVDSEGMWSEDMWSDDLGVITDDLGLEPDQAMLDRGPLPEPDMAVNPAPLVFTHVYFSATHNSYEGGDRRSVREQLEAGVRAIEYDVHDNDFNREGYRLGHLRHGEAVERGGGNPNTNDLDAWLDVIDQWSSDHPDHAPLLLTIDLKDNLMDNRSYDDGNLAHLNAVLINHLSRIWRPEDGTDDVDAARDHVLCILSGDRGTRRGYLHDTGSSPALAINTVGRALEVHDSGTGYLWYWGGSVVGDHVTWRRHGRYDSGRRPSILINAQGQVIEAHQSEGHSRLWASVGSVSRLGELTLESADRFSDGERPSLTWRDITRGLFTARYIRDGSIYERDGSADMDRGEISWSAEERAPSGAQLFTRDEVTYRSKQFRVTNDQAPSDYPYSTLWLQVTGEGVNVGEPVRYEQVCFVEWQRDEHSDALLGRQLFGALPGGDYARLPTRVKTQKVIRGWQYSGRNTQVAVPQIPSTDEPFSNSYSNFMDQLNTIE